MKYLRLITKNLGRNKRRTVLTVLSVSVSVFLLATMQAVIAALSGISNLTGGEYRVIVRRNTSIADSMPEAYGQKIAQVPGVVAACASNWFGGIYKEATSNSKCRSRQKRRPRFNRREPPPLPGKNSPTNLAGRSAT